MKHVFGSFGWVGNMGYYLLFLIVVVYERISLHFRRRCHGLSLVLW